MATDFEELNYEYSDDEEEFETHEVIYEEDELECVAPKQTKLNREFTLYDKITNMPKLKKCWNLRFIGNFRLRKGHITSFDKIFHIHRRPCFQKSMPSKRGQILEKITREMLGVTVIVNNDTPNVTQPEQMDHNGQFCQN